MGARVSGIRTGDSSRGGLVVVSRDNGLGQNFRIGIFFDFVNSV
jgi:hypothetical protein